MIFSEFLPKLSHAVTLTLYPLILNICSRSGIMRAYRILNLSEIDQSVAELLTFTSIFSSVLWVPQKQHKVL